MTWCSVPGGSIVAIASVADIARSLVMTTYDQRKIGAAVTPYIEAEHAILCYDLSHHIFGTCFDSH